jgi:branched-chain amino acid transport system permease protein
VSTVLLQAVASGIALCLIYAGIGAGFSLIVATGRLTNLSHGQFVLAAFFGGGALTQAWLVTVGGMPPWRARGVSALAGALVALPLTPALRLGPASFALATLAYATLLKGLAAIMPAVGTEGFLLPAFPGFDGAAPTLVAIVALLALAVSFGYAVFLGRPAGRAGGAMRQAPETALSLGIAADRSKRRVWRCPKRTISR